MQDFYCKKCGKHIVISSSGVQILFCEHHKPDKEKNKGFKNKRGRFINYYIKTLPARDFMYKLVYKNS